jgi:hypothetical protein
LGQWKIDEFTRSLSLRSPLLASNDRTNKLDFAHAPYDRLNFAHAPYDRLRSRFKITQLGARQGKNRRGSAVCMGVNEHFEPIFNAVLCQLRDFKTASKFEKTPRKIIRLYACVSPRTRFILVSSVQGSLPTIRSRR